MLWGIYSAIYGEVNVSVEKCVEIKGDYVEKQQSCFISVTLKSGSGRKLLDPTTYIHLPLTLCGQDTDSVFMFKLFKKFPQDLYLQGFCSDFVCRF